MNHQAYILVLYYSKHGSTKALAEEIALGVEAQGTFEARLRTVNPIKNSEEINETLTDDLLVTMDDLRHCAGLALGSPTHFGNMAAPLKHVIDNTTALWVSGALVDKPAIVFSSTSSLHGGQETTLLSMMLPLLHHGMLILGTPYTEDALHTTKSGGTPYGATHVSHGDNVLPLTTDEKKIAKFNGQRLGTIAASLMQEPS